MFEMAAGGQRPKEIAAIANRRGWRTGRDGGKWTARTVLKVLSNPIYAGLIRNGSQTLPGRQEAIVSTALFDQVRDLVESRRSRTPGRRKSTILWPLRGLLKCGRCRRTMSPSISGYRNFQYRYYRFRSTAGGRPPCRAVSLPAFKIERFVRTTICSGVWIELTPIPPEQRSERVREFVAKGGPCRNVPLTNRRSGGRESESLRRLATGDHGETWHFGTASRVSARSGEPAGDTAERRAKVAKPLVRCGFASAQRKTPGTLAPGDCRQPVGSGFPLLYIRLPE